MAVNFDRWTILKLIEVLFTLTCLIFKSITDDEASRLFLYLQKISREWSLLNNVTWSSVGSAVANVTYGGYFIITSALFIGRLFGEHPTQKRITEFILLIVGAILFIVLGSLEFAALDSVPHDLIDNAAVIGTLSLLTAALFLLDMGGPKARKTATQTQIAPKPMQVFNVEKAKEEKMEKVEKNGHLMSADGRYRDSMYKKIQAEKPSSFDIYGKDKDESEEEGSVEKIEEHSPVWSKIRKGQYGKYDILAPSYMSPNDQSPDHRPPSSPGDPGYVQYTAQHWGETVHKTPRQSPTQV